MSPPTNRVSHHLLQAQAIHNEVRAQRDAAVALLRDVVVHATDGAHADINVLIRHKARNLITRVDGFTKAEGETQL